MINHIKKILITTIILTYGNTIHAYTWTMNNFTKETLLVQIELKHSENAYFVLVPPRQSADFSWESGNAMAGFCLGKIKYLIPDQYLLKQQGLIDRQSMTVRDPRKLLNWLDKFSVMKNAKALGLKEPYVRKEVELRFMPDALFNQTVDEAKKLSGTDVGAKIVGWFADLVAQSKCRSRDIKIIERKAKKTDLKGDIGFYTLAN